MHLHLILLAQSTPSTTVAKNTKSSGSYVTLIVIVVIFAAVYFLFLRPRQQRMRQQQTSARQLSVGDEVMSAGGIYGRVVALDSDQVEVEVAPGVVMTFTRRAISARPQTPGGAAQSPEPVDEPWQIDSDGPASAGPSSTGSAGPSEPGSGTSGEDKPPASGPTGA